MWDFSFVLPSFLILIIFLEYYLFLPRLPLRKNLTFLCLILVEFFVITTDIVSTMMDMNHELFNDIPIYIVNIAFYVAFFARSFLFFLYTTNLVKLRRSDYTYMSIFIALPLLGGIIISVSSIWTKWLFYIDDNGFHHGPFGNILYVILFFYIIVSLILAFSFRSSFPRKTEWHATINFNLILLLGSILRKTLPHFLIMDTFCLMAIIIIYLSFENPDLYIERRTDIFNSLALRDYLYEMPRLTDYSYVAFIIHNYGDYRGIYGPRQMDAGLYMIGKYLSKTFPNTKIFYIREGRFVFICNKQSNEEHIIQSITERFEQPWISKNAELYLEANFVKMTPDFNINSVELILKVFIDALTKADKNNTHECIYITEEDFKAREKENIVIKALEDAIDNENLEVYYQPIVRATNQKIVGAEALARIFDSEGNMIFPSDFIPIAEKNGNIKEVGKQIFAKTCQFIKYNNIDIQGVNWINVNLSPTQFIMADLAKEYSEITEQIGIDAKYIRLEITEESLVDYTVLLKQIQRLSEKGFQFVLDDYGKGYSNLTRLKKLPFINIKIDMELVWAYCAEPGEILPTMIQGFKQMGFSITAEGIETANMANLMTKIGCDYLQGNYFSKPLPMNEFVKKAKELV